VLETVEIPLEDRWILSATLEKEAVAPTRTDYDALNDGAKFVVVAYEWDEGMSAHGNPQSAEYVYDAGSGMLVKSGAATIELTSGKEYKYVYYSYNSATAALPGYGGATISVSPNPGATPNNDLLWGKSDDRVEAGDPIKVSLEHKFTRVKLSVSTSEVALTDLSISSAVFETNHSGVFGVEDGLFKSSAATTAQALTPVGNRISTSVPAESEYRLVHLGGQTSVRVKMSGTIGSTSFSDLRPTFVSTFVAGESYVLRLRFLKTMAWASSNIYWDPDRGSLTFKGHGQYGGERYYQGVYFKWGSLVGISPKGAMGDSFVAGTNGSTDGTALYAYHEGQWRKTNVTTAYNATPRYAGFGAASWDGIPYKVGGAAGNRTDDNLGSSFSNNTGDICRYLSDQGLKVVPGKYRMPKSSEFEVGIGIDYFTDLNAHYFWNGQDPLASTIGWSRVNASYDPITSTDETGRQMFTGGYSPNVHGWYVTNYGAIFPASGARDRSNGQVSTYYAMQLGLYWSSSSYSGVSYSYMARFDYGYIEPRRAAFRAMAYPIRCLLDQQ
jgi:hypothetical protein